MILDNPDSDDNFGRWIDKHPKLSVMLGIGSLIAICAIFAIAFLPITKGVAQWMTIR